MKINISQVLQAMGGRQPFRFVRPVEKVVGALDRFWLEGDISVAGEVVNDGLFLKVAGIITGVADTSCHRCLKSFQKPVEVAFAENYRSEDSRDPDVPDDDYTYFGGEEIDITELIRETLLLAEPLKIVCDDNCKGLCLKCGADLNVAACGCDRETIDPRLASLKKLLDQD
ncbi:MAG: DUF177 domain-containing protein [Negativicutes bacterium]|nr:DUF177 domain-containing protein [Negativicutes bacterium]